MSDPVLLKIVINEIEFLCINWTDFSFIIPLMFMKSCDLYANL